MRTKTKILLLFVTFLCSCSIGQNKSNANEQDTKLWKQVELYDIYGLGIDDAIKKQLESLQVSIKNDTLIINEKYKARFDIREMNTNDFFFRNDMERTKVFFEKFFGNKGINISKTIQFIDISGYPEYYNSEFPFSDYLEPGNCAIYQPPYLFLVHNDIEICYTMPDFEEDSNSKSFAEDTPSQSIANKIPLSFDFYDYQKWEDRYDRGEIDEHLFVEFSLNKTLKKMDF